MKRIKLYVKIKFSFFLMFCYENKTRKYKTILLKMRRNQNEREKTIKYSIRAVQMESLEKLFWWMGRNGRKGKIEKHHRNSAAMQLEMQDMKLMLNDWMDLLAETEEQIPNVVP